MAKTKRAITAKAKKRATVRPGLGLPDSVLKLFPKTSRMGKSEPSRWGQAIGRKVRTLDRNDFMSSQAEYF